METERRLVFYKSKLESDCDFFFCFFLRELLWGTVAEDGYFKLKLLE